MPLDRTTARSSRSRVASRRKTSMGRKSRVGRVCAQRGQSTLSPLGTRTDGRTLFPVANHSDEMAVSTGEDRSLDCRGATAGQVRAMTKKRQILYAISLAAIGLIGPDERRSEMNSSRGDSFEETQSESAYGDSVVNDQRWSTGREPRRREESSPSGWGSRSSPGSTRSDGLHRRGPWRRPAGCSR
jgi:hypothetical protein